MNGQLVTQTGFDQNSLQRKVVFWSRHVSKEKRQIRNRRGRKFMESRYTGFRRFACSAFCKSPWEAWGLN